VANLKCLGVTTASASAATITVQTTGAMSCTFS
jgi:hypothetical protein